MNRFVLGVLSLALSSALVAQTSWPSFEVASVKPNKSGSSTMSQRALPNGTYTATNMALAELVGIAYQFDPALIEAPDWTKKERFDVVAKASAGSTTGLVTPATYYMLRSLLAERFNLVVRRASRERSMFVLRAVRGDKKLGARIRPSSATCPDPDPKSVDGRPIFQFDLRPGCSVAMGFGDISGRGMPLTALTHAITLRLHRSVRDDTGLTGRYDFDVRFTPDEVLTLAASRPPGQVPRAIGSDGKDIDPAGPSLMTALRDQLGLKLDSETGPVEVLVIDSATRPTPD